MFKEDETQYCKNCYELREQLDQLKFDYAELEKRHNDSFEQFKQLKEQLEAYKMEAEEGKEINAELKAENDDLKKQHQGDKGLITATGKMNYQLLQEYDKLKNCLTEIKEIAERDKEFCIKCNGNKEIDCVDCIEGGRTLLAKDILQKISECEVE